MLGWIRRQLIIFHNILYASRGHSAYQSDQEWPSERVSLFPNQGPNFGAVEKPQGGYLLGDNSRGCYKHEIPILMGMIGSQNNRGEVVTLNCQKQSDCNIMNSKFEILASVA